MPISDNLKKIRTLRGYTVPKLADMMGIKKQSIYDWEDGKYKPSQENIDKLVNILGITEKDLYADEITELPDLPGKNSLQVNIDRVYRELVEANSDYRLVPKSILEDKYRIVSITTLEKESRQMEIERERESRDNVEKLEAYKLAIATKDRLIEKLEADLERLRSSAPAEKGK